MNIFDASGWTGSAMLIGKAGLDQLIVTRDTNMTLTNTALMSDRFGTLTFVSIENAILTGGRIGRLARP